MAKAVFLDRDDTLVDNRFATAHTAHPGDLIDPALVRILPGAAEGCRRLSDAGYLLVIITNQGGVAEGICTLRDIEAVNDRVRELFSAQSVEFAGIYYSPARPTGTTERFRSHTDWRKPAPGMIRQAVRELKISLDYSWVVGDSPRDVESGIAAGISPARCLMIGEDTTLPDLDAAATVILAAAPAPQPLPASASSTVRLRALEGTPLSNTGVAETVRATARAIAERTGVPLLNVTTDPSGVEVTLGADRLSGLGFLVELRRLTNAWYRSKYGAGSLWGEAPESGGWASPDGGPVDL